MPVCPTLAFPRAARLRGSRAEHPTQLLDRGDRQGAGEVAADIGSGFPILPLQGCKERQLAVEEPSAVSICDHQHLSREGAVRAREHRQRQPAGPSTPLMLRAGSVPPHTLSKWRGDGQLKGSTPGLCHGPTVVTPYNASAGKSMMEMWQPNHTKHLAARMKHRDRHIPA